MHIHVREVCTYSSAMVLWQSSSRTIEDSRNAMWPLASLVDGTSIDTVLSQIQGSSDGYRIYNLNVTAIATAHRSEPSKYIPARPQASKSME